jgi:hypothetical protein
MHFERWVFAQALMDYFAHAAQKTAKPSEIIAALGLDAKTYAEAQAHHEARLMRGIATDDLSLATQFAEIFTRAKAHLRATKPTLDDLKASTRLAAPPAPPVSPDSVDETALLRVHVPNVVMPFGGPKATGPTPARPPVPPVQTSPRQPSPPPARPLMAPPVLPPPGADETVLAPAVHLPSKALPFEVGQGTERDPNKGRR